MIVFRIQDTIEIKVYDTVTHVIYTIGSEQYSLRLHDLQCFPIQTSSNCLIACSTISDSSVRMPASKLRLLSVFKPMPAPVRLALPRYTSLQSNTIILK